MVWARNCHIPCRSIRHSIVQLDKATQGKTSWYLMTSHDISWHVMIISHDLLTCDLWCDCLLYHLAQIAQNFMRRVRSGCVACWNMPGQTWRHERFSFWTFWWSQNVHSDDVNIKMFFDNVLQWLFSEARDANGATPVIFAAIYLAVCCESIGSQCSRLEKMQRRRLLIPSGFLLRSSVAASGAWNSGENLAKE